MAIDEREYFYTPKVFRRKTAPIDSSASLSRFSWPIALPFWLVVLGLGYWALSDFSGFKKPMPLPVSAPLLINQQLGAPLSPLTIRTPANSGKRHFFVKLEDWSSHNLAATLFVRGGESVATKIAPGTYRMRVATGESWFGQENLFGSSTVVMTTKNSLTFTTTQGHIIDLTQVVSGNLPMDHGGRF